MIVDFEIDFRAFAPANPIALKQFDSLGPIQFFEIVEQSLSIGSDAQHPLPHWPSNHRESTNFALSIHDFFVGQNCAELSTPVDRDIRNIGESNALRITSAIG